MWFNKTFSFPIIFLCSNIFVLTAQNNLNVAEYNLTQFHQIKNYNRADILKQITPKFYQSNPDFGICFNDSLNWFELIQKRTSTTRTYISSNGDSIYQYAADEINYFKNGWWQAIDPRLSPTQNGWAAMHQLNPTHLLPDGSTEISLGDFSKLKFNINSKINGTAISSNNYSVGDNGMYIHSAFPGIDKKIVFRKNEIESDYIIQNASAVVGSTDLIISEEINLPEGFTIKKDFLKGEVHNGNWMGELVVYDTDQNEKARFRTPVFYDSNTNPAQRNNSFLVGTYRLTEAIGKYILEIIVPADWLKNPERVFPITIDPIVTGPTVTWDEFRPGFLEADTVAHCGGSSAGEYVNTVDFVDIATAWTEQRAVWGKGETAVLEQIKDVEASLPFALLGFDSDNGGEFLNYHLLRHFADNRKTPIQFTRSRAYKKDDNAHIEQKNYTHVRQKLGYRRFENQKMVELLNDLYKNEWRLYHNFFLPSVKLIEKERIRSKVIKKHDKPQTPYQRVLLADAMDVSNTVKQKLTKQFESLNPFALKKIINKKIEKILNLAS